MWVTYTSDSSPDKYEDINVFCLKNPSRWVYGLWTMNSNVMFNILIWQFISMLQFQFLESFISSSLRLPYKIQNGDTHFHCGQWEGWRLIQVQREKSVKYGKVYQHGMWDWYMKTFYFKGRKMTCFLFCKSRMCWCSRVISLWRDTASTNIRQSGASVSFLTIYIRLDCISDLKLICSQSWGHIQGVPKKGD